MGGVQPNIPASKASLTKEQQQQDSGNSLELVNEEIMTLYELLERQGVSESNINTIMGCATFCPSVSWYRQLYIVAGEDFSITYGHINLFTLGLEFFAYIAW